MGESFEERQRRRDNFRRSLAAIVGQDAPEPATTEAEPVKRDTPKRRGRPRKRSGGSSIVGADRPHAGDDGDQAGAD